MAMTKTKTMTMMMTMTVVVVSVWSELAGPVFFFMMEYGHTEF